MGPTTVDALDALRAEVRELRAEVRALRRPAEAGDANLEVLLGAIHREVNAATFRAEDLLALSLHRPALAAALGPFVDADSDLRSLGKMLGRARDRGPFGELVIESLGRPGGRVTTWRVRALSRFQSAPQPQPERAR